MRLQAAGQYGFESQPVGRGMAHLAKGLESQSRIRAAASIENTARSCSSHSLPSTRMWEQDWVCGYPRASSKDIEDISDSNPGPGLGNPEQPSPSFCQMMRFQARLRCEVQATIMISQPYEGSVVILSC